MWEAVGGTGIWTNYKNSETGEESVKQHKLKEVKRWCPMEFHEFDDVIPANRQLTCKKCGQQITFIVGFHDLKAGRIVNRSQ